MSTQLIETVTGCFFDIMGFNESDGVINIETFYDKYYHDFFIRFTGSSNGDYLIYMGVQLDNNAGHKSSIHISVDGEIFFTDEIDTSELVSTIHSKEVKDYIIKFSERV